jgi:hypothetical protein
MGKSSISLVPSIGYHICGEEEEELEEHGGGRYRQVIFLYRYFNYMYN